jgi:hypothetical protein
VCTKDECWSVGMIYDLRELPGVSTASPRIGRGVTIHNYFESKFEFESFMSFTFESNVHIQILV